MRLCKTCTVTVEETPDTPVPDRPWARRAAATEDAFHRWRERRARRRGLTPVVIPYRGYGGCDWVRVLCRVLLTRQQLQARVRADLQGLDLVADLLAERRATAVDEDAA